MKNHKKFYEKYFQERISFTKKFSYVYKQISCEINKIINKSSNILFLSAGHSSILDMINFKKGFVYEIIDSFHSLYSKKNISKIESINSLNKFKNKNIDNVIITNLEYSEDPIKLLHNINSTIQSNANVTIVSNNIFWNPIFKITEIIGLKFRHPRKNLITPAFIENLCFISDFNLIKKKKIILFPFKIPLISKILNNFIASLPIINLFCLITLYVLKSSKSSKKKINDFSVSIIIPCKNEEKNVKVVANSIKKIGRSTEILFGDDKSEDNTKTEIKKLQNLKNDLDIILYEGPGKGKSHNVYKGFNLASGDILVIHDADNTVDPKEINQIVKTLVEKNQNMVIGTRLVYPMEKNAMKFSNYLGNLFFSYFYSFILQQRITDTLCGTKAIFKKDWEKIEPYCGSWGVTDKWGDFDLLSGAKINMMRITEIPVNYKQRIEGQTKMTNTISNGIRMLFICIFSYFRIRFK